MRMTTSKLSLVGILSFLKRLLIVILADMDVMPQNSYNEARILKSEDSMSESSESDDDQQDKFGKNICNIFKLLIIILDEPDSSTKLK